MRNINQQLEDIISGHKTIAEILVEGVHRYALANYSPATAAEKVALAELRRVSVYREKAMRALSERLAAGRWITGREARG